MTMRAKRTRVARGCIVGLILASGCAIGPASAADALGGGVSEGGMKGYIDPNTGAIIEAPAPGTPALPLSAQERNAMSTSHEGLVETPSPTPGGGFKLDLRGRFQSPLVGVIDADGKTSMRHSGETPHGDHVE
jgi:hypothetical protein